MNTKLSPIIKAEDLASLDHSVVIIDASAGSKDRYNQSHLKGALFVDVNTDLADIGDFARGGRHPLPTLAHFSHLLQKLGIEKNSHVVVYDDKNGANAAARFWWMLRAIGHEQVQVIDGGYDAAIKAGFPTSAAIEAVNTVAPYQVTSWALPLTGMNEVESAVKASDYIVVDVRDANRFAGLTEPIDLIAGHIPGAVNIPFTENLKSDGTFQDPQVLREKYTSALGSVSPENVIVHCGSGITACHTLLAMDYAGLTIPSLYVGSWSEWSRNKVD